MNILSGISSSLGMQGNPDKWTPLTSKNVECQKQPILIRPISEEYKIRNLLNMQDPKEKLYKHYPRAQEKMLHDFERQRTTSTSNQCQCHLPTSTATCQCAGTKYTKKHGTSYWHELVMLDGFPLDSVRAYWAQQHRCFIVTAKTAQMDKGWKTKRPQQLDHFCQENVSPLTQLSRWTEEKNMHRLKRIIPLPNYVCGRDVECFMDTERAVFLVCARRRLSQTEEGTQQPEQQQQLEDMKSWIEKECLLGGGNEHEMHQRCEPTKILLKTVLGSLSSSSSSHQQQQQSAATGGEDWERLCKSIIMEGPELQHASELLRCQLKTVKANLFPGLMQSPRFVKDEKTGQWCVRLQLRLRSADFRPEEVRVQPDERRHCVVVEAKHDIRDLITRRMVEVRAEIPLCPVVDVGKVHYTFVISEGVLRMEIPLNVDKVRDCCQQQSHQTPKKM
jgi:hypothetical protein